MPRIALQPTRPIRLVRTIRRIGLLGALCVCAAASAGAISGKVTNPAQCSAVDALLRDPNNPLKPKVFHAAYDPRTGAFRSPNLAPGTYDLRLQIPGGVLEGVDMRVDRPDGVEIKELTPEDALAIDKEVTKPVAAYMDFHRTILTRGNSERACALVEMVRHRPAYGRPKDEITWGVELWYFENWTGAWVRPRASLQRRKVLRRLRVPADMPKDEFDAMICLFSPDLGGLDVAEDKSVEGLSVTVPKPDVSLGKVAGSVAAQIQADREANPDRFDK